MSEPLADKNSFFSLKSFQILESLYDEASRQYFLQKKQEFKKYIKEPFDRLFSQVVAQLPNHFIEQMETPKPIFGQMIQPSRVSWDYYVGSLYFRTQSHTKDTQLYISIDHELFAFGFYISEHIGVDLDDYASQERKRFLFNCRKNYESVMSIFRDYIIDDVNLVYGDWDDYTKPDDKEARYTWEEWLNNPDAIGINVAAYLTKEQILNYPDIDLIELIAQTYKRLFPLVLLAIYDDPMPVIEKCLNKPTYTLVQCFKETGFEKDKLKQWVRGIDRKKQIILYGSPGTGKTFIAQKLAQHLISDSDGFSELVQFHPAYTYEDFIQGIRPQSKNGQLTYSIVPGRFLEFCQKAESREGICVLIIDEINRANLAQVFGELMYLLEYRDKEIPLAGGNTFSIPSNVRLIGTMNTADRSIALVDHALCRRFAFIEIRPNYDVLRNYHEKRNTGFKVDGLIQVLQKLNRAIADKNYELGISFFLTEKLAEDIEDIWKMEIEPYLEEYFFDRLEKVDEFRWDKIEKQVLP